MYVYEYKINEMNAMFDVRNHTHYFKWLFKLCFNQNFASKLLRFSHIFFKSSNYQHLIHIAAVAVHKVNVQYLQMYMLSDSYTNINVTYSIYQLTDSVFHFPLDLDCLCMITLFGFKM